mmetsp:Transcript_4761/g.17113  ORF Transcript_4761/g.17113 Transcript_4761/m.17113 type:complete len:202 (+) Transcript_4761:130-735(+)
MAGADVGGDATYSLKTQRLWCIFLISVIIGMVFYQAVMAGVISAEVGFKATADFILAICIIQLVFFSLGCCGAYGFYERILGFYGLMGLLMSLLFFIAFIVILVAVASTTGKNKFIDECSDSMNSGTDGQTEEDVELHCEAYFETVKPPAVAILVIQLIITFLLATSSFLAFKLRWNASMASGQHVSKTVRYEPQEDEGTF